NDFQNKLSFEIKYFNELEKDQQGVVADAYEELLLNICKDFKLSEFDSLELNSNISYVIENLQPIDFKVVHSMFKGMHFYSPRDKKSTVKSFLLQIEINLECYRLDNKDVSNTDVSKNFYCVRADLN